MRYKIVACILLVLSVFNFVLAAPVPVREVREACADAVGGGETVIIVSGKRGNPGEGADPAESDLYPIDLSDTESDLYPINLSDTESDLYPIDLTDTVSPQSPSTPDDASGSHPGVDMPSSPSGGSKSPGGTEVPLDTEGAFKPGTTTENPPVSGETKSVSWGPTTKVHFYDKDPFERPLPRPPGRKGYLAKVAAQQSQSPDIEHDVLSSSHFSPPPQSPPKPQSKGFVSNFKTYFSKLGKLKFRPRFQRTTDTGA
jgi:hypothetical protein